MAASAIELPLFPLNVVLFPGTVLPLHIFEPRYRQMIRDCQQEGRPFGVVLAKADSEFMYEEPHTVGTLAEIYNLQELADGGYDLIALGIRRFRIMSHHREKEYLSGFVELYDDEPEAADAMAQCAQSVHTLFETYLQLLLDASADKATGSAAHVRLPDSPEELSHMAAYFLEIEDTAKQRFLEMNSTYQRLQEEDVILRREVPFMRQLLSKKLDEDTSMLN